VQIHGKQRRHTGNRPYIVDFATTEGHNELVVQMVLEKPDCGVVIPTMEPDSLTTDRQSETDSQISGMTQVHLTDSDVERSTCPAVADVDVVGSSSVTESVFTFPIPGEFDASPDDRTSDNGSLTPTTLDQSEVVDWFPPSAEDTSDFAGSSSAADSGWASRCSLVSSDYRPLETPSPSTPSSVTSRSPGQGPVTPGLSQRRSFTQLVKGIFTKNTDKVKMALDLVAWP